MSRSRMVGTSLDLKIEKKTTKSHPQYRDEYTK
jgi:hypothetical protein